MFANLPKNILPTDVVTVTLSALFIPSCFYLLLKCLVYECMAGILRGNPSWNIVGFYIIISFMYVWRTCELYYLDEILVTSGIEFCFISKTLARFFFPYVTKDQHNEYSLRKF